MHFSSRYSATSLRQNGKQGNETLFMKKKTRESVFTFARNRCSRSLGIGVHVQSESVFTFARNRCSRSLGIGVHVRSESVFTFSRNRCSRSLGIGVHVRSESVFTFARNRCSRSVGIGVHVQSESVFTFSRNMHQIHGFHIPVESVSYFKSATSCCLFQTFDKTTSTIPTGHHSSRHSTEAQVPSRRSEAQGGQVALDRVAREFY